MTTCKSISDGWRLTIWVCGMVDLGPVCDCLVLWLQITTESATLFHRSICDYYYYFFYCDVSLMSLRTSTGPNIHFYLGAYFSSFPQYFNISLTSGVKLHIHLLNVAVWLIFASLLQIWYVEVRISQGISESPLDFEITRVHRICFCWLFHSHPSVTVRLCPYVINPF